MKAILLILLISTAYTLDNLSDKELVEFNKAADAYLAQKSSIWQTAGSINSAQVAALASIKQEYSSKKVADKTAFKLLYTNGFWHFYEFDEGVKKHNLKIPGSDQTYTGDMYTLLGNMYKNKQTNWTFILSSFWEDSLWDKSRTSVTMTAVRVNPDNNMVVDWVIVDGDYTWNNGKNWALATSAVSQGGALPGDKTVYHHEHIADSNDTEAKIMADMSIVHCLNYMRQVKAPEGDKPYSRFMMNIDA